MEEEKLQELADDFFKVRDLYAFNNDGAPTKEFVKWLKEEHNIKRCEYD